MTRQGYIYKDSKLEPSGTVSFDTKNLREMGLEGRNQVKIVGGLRGQLYRRKNTGNQETAFGKYEFLIDVIGNYLIQISNLPDFLEFSKGNISTPSDDSNDALYKIWDEVAEIRDSLAEIRDSLSELQREKSTSNPPSLALFSIGI